MKKFIAALMVAVLLFTVAMPGQSAKADAILISQLAAAAYAVASSSGLTMTFTAGTAAGAQTYMEQRLSSWINGQSQGINIFGSTPVRALMGKMALTKTALDAIVDFIEDWITTDGIGTNPVTLQNGTVAGAGYDQVNTSFAESSGLWVNLDLGSTTPSETYPGFYTGSFSADIYIGQTRISGKSWSYTSQPHKVTGWRITARSGVTDGWRLRVYWEYYSGGYLFTGSDYKDFTSDALAVQDGIVAVISDGMTFPDDLGLNDLQTYEDEEWAPDTNLEDMIRDIFEKIADNDLVLDPGKVAEPPQPTVAPTNPPVSDIPGQLGGISGTLDDIASDIGDISGSLEGVGSAVGSISESLEGVGSAVETITEALEIPTTSEATQLQLPDLRTLFPFCIPFDIYNIITAFNASPVAPHVQIPFNIPAIGLNYTFDLDFSAYNSVAAVLRTLEFVAYAVGLAILTSKVIRW